MEIKVGNYVLIHSGTVIDIKDNPISITLPDDIEGDYTFIFNFKRDTNNKNPTTNISVIDKYKLQIDLVNFEGFMGGGNSELIEVGTLKKKPLFLNYRIFDLTNVGKTLIFNFYIRKEVKNGN